MNRSQILLDVCELIVDCEHKTAPTQETGYPSIRTPNIGQGHLLLDNVKRVSEETYKAWTKRAVPQAEDLILAREAPIGNVAIIPDNLKVCLGQRTVLIRPDKSKVNPHYLCYLLLGDDIQGKIQSLSNGATVHHLNMQDIRNLELPELPPIATQRKIADILSNYDRLIENNTCRIKILEEMAQLLYREWFVNFRFPGYEQTSMVESELGLIPQHWTYDRLEDLSVQIIDGDRSKNYPKREEFLDTGVLFLNTKNIVDHKLDLSEANFVSEEKYSTIKKGRAEPLDIIMTTRGSIGKVALFNCSNSKALINAQMLILRADNRVINQIFLFYSLRSDRGQKAITNFSSGSAQPQIPIVDLKKVKFLCPPIELQNSFAEFTSAINRNIGNLQSKNSNLHKTRDLLLPKLISGEIDIEAINTSDLADLEDIAA